MNDNTAQPQAGENNAVPITVIKDDGADISMPEGGLKPLK
jgi:hypothetical protein